MASLFTRCFDEIMAQGHKTDKYGQDANVFDQSRRPAVAPKKRLLARQAMYNSEPISKRSIYGSQAAAILAGKFLGVCKFLESD